MNHSGSLVFLNFAIVKACCLVFENCMFSIFHNYYLDEYSIFNM